MDDETVEHIPRGGHGGVRLRLKADTVKVTEWDENMKAKKVSIGLSKEEARKICEALSAKEYQGCFSEASQPSDSFDLFFEERQV